MYKELGPAKLPCYKRVLLFFVSSLYFSFRLFADDSNLFHTFDPGIHDIDSKNLSTVEPRYNEDLGPMKITLLYIRYLVISG